MRATTNNNSNTKLINQSIDGSELNQSIVGDELKRELFSIESKAEDLYNEVMSKENIGTNYKNRANTITDEFLQLKNLAIQKARHMSSFMTDMGKDDWVHMGRLNDIEFTIEDNVRSVLSSSPWDYIIGGTKVVTTLSDVYCTLDFIDGTCDDDPKRKDACWIPPSSFERSTHKYWVDPKYIPDVMVKCVSEVPILIYGKDDSTKEKIAQHSTSDIWNHISTTITSIYFDSPGSMTLYKDRLSRIQGAQLFRIRWYGDNPSPSGLLFLELKTHHEQWVQNKSIKERVALRAKDVTHILAGSKDGGKDLTNDRAKSIVLAAKPQLNGDELQEAIDLLLRIYNLILKKNLRPRVRSTYRRVSFQSPTDNKLRFTLDRDVTLSSEAGTTPHSWCLGNDAQSAAQSVTLPVAIFEVKLNSADAPDWLEALLHQSKICDGHKFSKYLTGASALFPNHIVTLPYWASDPMFKDIYGAILGYSGSAEEGITPIESVSTTSSKIPAHSDTHMIANALESSMTSYKSKRKISFFAKLPWSKSNHREEEARGLLPRVVAPKQKIRIEPKTYFAAERTFIQWISASLLLITVGALLFTISAEQSNASAPRVSGIVLTFIAVIVTVYALIIYYRRLHLLEHAKPYGYSDHFAPIILTFACLTGIGCILYYAIGWDSGAVDALCVYEDQCYRMDYRGVAKLSYQPNDIHIDHERNVAYVPSGDQITTIGLSRTKSEKDSEDSNTHLVRLVARASRDGLESVVWVDGDETLFAVSEKSMLYAFHWKDHHSSNNGDSDRSDNNIKTSAAMQMVGRWKLDDEAGSKSIVYRPPDPSDPDSFITGNGSLYISTTAGEVLVFDVPEIATGEDDPFFPLDSEEFSPGDSIHQLYPLYKLNSNIAQSVQTGDDSVKITSMQIFERVLFILFDHAGVIRGYDFRSGSMVYELKPPRIRGEGGLHKKWKGMFFERSTPKLPDVGGKKSSASTESNTGGGLRSSNVSANGASVVQLHMVLDEMPAEFWTFTMIEKVGKTMVSSLKFPACGAA